MTERCGGWLIKTRPANTPSTTDSNVVWLFLQFSNVHQGSPFLIINITRSGFFADLPRNTQCLARYALGTVGTDFCFRAN